MLTAVGPDNYLPKTFNGVCDDEKKQLSHVVYATAADDHNKVLGVLVGSISRKKVSISRSSACTTTTRAIRLHTECGTDS